MEFMAAEWVYQKFSELKEPFHRGNEFGKYNNSKIKNSRYIPRYLAWYVFLLFIKGMRCTLRIN